MDIGREGTVVENFKKAGWRILIFPFVIIFGTLIGSLAGALILPSLGIRDALAIGSGLWLVYAGASDAFQVFDLRERTFFMHNVMRELFGILLIPIVWQKNRVQYETVALPGAAAMDVCLPIRREKATKRGHCGTIPFVSGVVLSIAAPVFSGMRSQEYRLKYKKRRRNR